jgi:murein DD-endopeptidase MepM/ murein hydrolase activator NlpD
MLDHPGGEVMSVFPLKFRPTVTWHKNPTGTHFGAARDGGYPVHGACDLVAPAGAKVVAIRDGYIFRGPYEFATYADKTHTTTTYAIEVAHDYYTARYCEISQRLADGLSARRFVSEGQVIGAVGEQVGNSMLHFELFQDAWRRDDLTQRSHHTKYRYVLQNDYERRDDLLNPTSLLDRLYSEAPDSFFKS